MKIADLISELHKFDLQTEVLMPFKEFGVWKLSMRCSLEERTFNGMKMLVLEADDEVEIPAELKNCNDVRFFLAGPDCI